MVMSKLKDKIKHTFFYYPISITKSSLREIPQMITSIVVKLMPVKKNKVVFSSYQGMQYNAQPLKIFKALETHAGILDIVWILPDDVVHPNTCRTVKPNSLRSVYELMTASVWIDNCRKPYWLKKKKDQFYIQTWHGPVCIKAVEKDARETLPPYYVVSAIQDSKNADYIVAETKWRADNIRNSFWFDGSFIEGEFIEENEIDETSVREKIEELYSLPSTCKIVIYAPTFRKDDCVDQYLSEFDFLKKELDDVTGMDWRFIVRLHPNIARKANFTSYNEYVVNGTLYGNIDELIIASDYVITDYSGCIFQGYRAKKNVILYAKDYEEYIANDRNVYFDFKALPSPLVQTLSELESAIVEFDQKFYDKKREKFVQNLGYYSSNAAILCKEKILDFIEKGMKL